MDNNWTEILNKNLKINVNAEKKSLFEKYMRIFLEKNAHINLISKNDEQFLFEKHIFDSLAISKILDVKTSGKLLDIGTGGGFPAVPISILFDNLEVYPLDSIRKKIKVIEDIKAELHLENINPICERAENIKDKFDYITTRAVAPIETIAKYAAPLLKKNGYFIAYKSKQALKELDDAQKILKILNLKVLDIITYKLPLNETFERNLILIKKIK